MAPPLILSEPLLAAAAGACLLVGLGAGALAGWPRGGWARGAALVLVALTLAALALSLAALVPGRAGLRLDGAAPGLLAYCAGCGLGAAGRALLARRVAR